MEVANNPSSKEVKEILEFSRKIGPKLQLNSPGYLPNKRQQAMCGLAALELAQVLLKVNYSY